jgi:hypothetical protein
VKRHIAKQQSMFMDVSISFEEVFYHNIHLWKIFEVPIVSQKAMAFNCKQNRNGSLQGQFLYIL